MCINLFSWSLNCSCNSLFFISCRSSLYRHINNFCFTSIYLKLNIFSNYSRLYIFFFNSRFTRNSDWNINNFSSIINNRFFIFCFSINWSWYNLLSNDRSLNYSLFNDRLLNYFFGDDWLWNNLFCYYWFRIQFLSLSDHWFFIKHFITIRWMVILWIVLHLTFL